MTKTLFALFLTLTLTLSLAACSTSQRETLALPLTHALGISEDLAAELAESAQTLELTSEQETTTLQVRQTLGNSRELYVLYDVTFANGTSPKGLLPQTLCLTGKEESQATGGLGTVIPLAQAGQTVTFLSHFFAKHDVFPDGEVVLTVGDFKNEAIQISDRHTLTWTPTNRGEVRSQEITGEGGETLGSLTLSPFSLTYTLASPQQTTYEDLAASLALVDQTGQAAHPAGSAPAGFAEAPLRDVRGALLFQSAVDLNTIKAVQIDGRTVTFD